MFIFVKIKIEIVLVGIYYRGTMGFILMYDITNDESFNAIKNWYVK